MIRLNRRWMPIALVIPFLAACAGERATTPREKRLADNARIVPDAGPDAQLGDYPDPHVEF